MTFDEELRFAWYLGQRAAQLFDAGRSSTAEYRQIRQTYKNLYSQYQPHDSDKNHKIRLSYNISLETY